MTDLGCASSVVHLLESLVDLTPVVDSVEAALLKEAELRVKCLDWEDLERTHGFLAVAITSFIKQFNKMLAALTKVDRGNLLGHRAAAGSLLDGGRVSLARGTSAAQGPKPAASTSDGQRPGRLFRPAPTPWLHQAHL